MTEGTNVRDKWQLGDTTAGEEGPDEFATNVALFFNLAACAHGQVPPQARMRSFRRRTSPRPSPGAQSSLAGSGLPEVGRAAPCTRGVKCGASEWCVAFEMGSHQDFSCANAMVVSGASERSVAST